MRETTSRMVFVGICAWLSVCLLIIGWMPELDQAFRFVWMISGLTGLVSCVGLSERIKTDISSQERLIKMYRTAATTDCLTGLANRQVLEDGLRSAMSDFCPQRNPLSLILFDIDHFKRFNDQYGHQAGDAAIVTVSRAALEFFAGRGCSARYGGEEFAVAVPSMSLKESYKLADEFRQLIGQTECQYRSEKFQVSISVGVAEAKENESPDSLIRRADEALYAAKRSGRNCTKAHTLSDANSKLTESVSKSLSSALSPSLSHHSFGI